MDKPVAVAIKHCNLAFQLPVEVVDPELNKASGIKSIAEAKSSLEN